MNISVVLASILTALHLYTRQTPLTRHQLRNPWPGEGRAKVLHSTVQQKEKKAGAEGRMALSSLPSLMEKEWSCDQYFHRLKGEYFADYARLRFPQIFLDSANLTAKRFLQDGIQFKTVCAAARRAFQEVEAVTFAIPPTVRT